MNSSRRTNKRTFYPPRTFDQDLQIFVQLADEQGWHFSGVDLDQLARDSVEQARERAAFDEAEAKFDAIRERFALGQDSRYRRYAAALNAARGAFHGNEPVAQQLERFKRSNPRSVRSPDHSQRRTAIPSATESPDSPEGSHDADVAGSHLKACNR